MGKFSSIILLFAVVLSLQSEAQIAHHAPGSALRQAHKYFHQQAYQHALALYHKVLKGSPQNQEVKLRIADCYRFIQDAGNASFWYGQVAEDPAYPPGEHWLHLAGVLCNQQKYQQAQQWYSKYLEHFPGDQKALTALKSIKDLHKLYDPSFRVEPLTIKGLDKVFSAAIWEEKLVFVAPGQYGGVMRKLATWNESPYLDLYYANLSEGGPGPANLMDQKMNSVYHEGPACFYDQGGQVIFTRSAHSRSTDLRRNLQLFWSKQNQPGKWTKPQPLEINHRDYSLGHPAVDESGQILYFVSDMPGGYGGTDIYRSRKVHGKWQVPQNLGPSINTSGDELFPTLYQGILYYASNGLGGLGGLDIFRVDVHGNEPPANMGFPVNSPHDDFSLVWSNDAQGFLSSNRSGKERIMKFIHERPKK